MRKPTADFWNYQNTSSYGIRTPSVDDYLGGLPAYSADSDGGSGGKGGGRRGKRTGGRGGGGGSNPMQGPTQYFGQLLIALALYGFYTKNSQKSLIFGMMAGFTLIFASTLMADAAVKIGPLVALVVSAGLAYKFYQRYQTTKQLVPAGVVSGVAALMSVGYVVTLF